MKNRYRYFSSYKDDFENEKFNNAQLPNGYKWVKNSFAAKVISAVVYSLAVAISNVYLRLFLHMRIIGKSKLKSTKSGCFIYGNHTQPVGDVFIPAHCALPKRIYTLVSTANYGIPVVRKILPYLGALPISGDRHGLVELTKAIKYRIGNGNAVVIYPEAHVWEYYTDIRPFGASSFKFPSKLSVPSFSMTATYTKSKLFKKPLMTVYIDGPFFAEGDSDKEKAENLKNTIYNTMKQRSQCSNYSYIRYIPKVEKSVEK